MTSAAYVPLGDGSAKRLSQSVISASASAPSSPLRVRPCEIEYRCVELSDTIKELDKIIKREIASNALPSVVHSLVLARTERAAQLTHALNLLQDAQGQFSPPAAVIVCSHRASG
jgi:hypothetical protein